jgi:hypothetical protein
MEEVEAEQKHVKQDQWNERKPVAEIPLDINDLGVVATGTRFSPFCTILGS